MPSEDVQRDLYWPSGATYQGRNAVRNGGQPLALAVDRGTCLAAVAGSRATEGRRGRGVGPRAGPRHDSRGRQEGHQTSQAQGRPAGRHRCSFCRSWRQHCSTGLTVLPLSVVSAVSVVSAGRKQNISGWGVS